MGKSYTYHVIGYAPTNEARKYRTFFAMNKREIAQQREQAKREGLKIKWWESQTKTGNRILGKFEWAKDEEVKVKNIVTCPICNGKGYNGRNETGIKQHCLVCDGSGVTSKGYERKWAEWQLNDMREGR